MTRLVRVMAVGPTPIVPVEVVAAAPGRGRWRLAIGVRVALGMIGFGQFVLGMVQLSGFSAGHDHPGGVIDAAHLLHER